MLPLFFLLQAAAGPLDVSGVWLTENGQSQVEVAREGESVRGEIIWYEGHDEEPAFDTKNPDPEKRGEEILGLAILEGFEKAEEKWRRGEIYDPTSGKTYRSAIHRESDDILAVEGCVGFICKTQEWQRVPQGEVKRIERAPKERSGATR